MTLDAFFRTLMLHVAAVGEEAHRREVRTVTLLLLDTLFVHGSLVPTTLVRVVVKRAALQGLSVAPTAVVQLLAQLLQQGHVAPVSGAKGERTKPYVALTPAGLLGLRRMEAADRVAAQAQAQAQRQNEVQVKAEPEPEEDDPNTVWEHPVAELERPERVQRPVIIDAEWAPGDGKDSAKSGPDHA